MVRRLHKQEESQIKVHKQFIEHLVSASPVLDTELQRQVRMLVAAQG